MGYTKKEIVNILKDIPLRDMKLPLTNGALVLEGGAFRGVYQEGVVDCLLDNGILFQTVIGVSAGALNGLNYIAGQRGRSAHINIKYRHDGRYVGVNAFLKSRLKSVIGFDYVFGKLPEIPDLAMDEAKDKNRKLIAVATSIESGKAYYFDSQRDDILTCIKASATLPYISRPVKIDGKSFVDGGCADRIPFKYALECGYKNVVVVRTRDKEYRTKTNYEKRLKMTKRFYPKYKQFTKKLASSDDDYNVLCDELELLENENQVFVIYPSEPLHVKMLEGDLNKLKDLYMLGYKDTLERIDDLKKYLNR